MRAQLSCPNSASAFSAAAAAASSRCMCAPMNVVQAQSLKRPDKRDRQSMSK